MLSEKSEITDDNVRLYMLIKLCKIREVSMYTQKNLPASRKWVNEKTFHIFFLFICCPNNSRVPRLSKERASLHGKKKQYVLFFKKIKKKRNLFHYDDMDIFVHVHICHPSFFSYLRELATSVSS